MPKKKVTKKAPKKGLKAKAKATENPRMLFAYGGVTTDSKGKVFHIYHEVGEEWEQFGPAANRVYGTEVGANDGSVRWYSKRFGHATPGTIISIEYNVEKADSVYGGTARRVGTYDADTCAQWNAESRAVEDAKASKSAAQKAERDHKESFAVLLEPIRKAYQSCRNESQRVSILSRVSAIITRYKA